MISQPTIHPGSLLIPILAGCLLGSCGSREPDDLAARAARLRDKGLPIEAAHLLKDALGALPPDRRPPIRLEIARLYHQAGAYSSALEELGAPGAAGSEPPEALYLRGDCLRRLSRPAEAGEAIGRLLALQPEHRGGLLCSAILRRLAGESEASIALFDKYFRSAPPPSEVTSAEAISSEARIELGRALKDAGRFQEAADAFVMVLEQDPLAQEACSELTTALFRLGRRASARWVEGIYKSLAQSSFEEHVEEGLLRSGASAFGLAQRAANHVRRLRFLEAFRDYRSALELNRSDARIASLYADLCLRFSWRREALEVLEQASRAGASPASGIAWMTCRALLEARRHPEAIEAGRKALEALRREGDLGGAEKGQAPRRQLLLALARAAIEGGVPGETQAWLEPIGAEGGWEALYWKGRLELAQGRAQPAGALFQEAEAAGGKVSADLRYHRALALEKEGRVPEALQAFERLAAELPGLAGAFEALLRLAPRDAPARPAWESRARELSDLQARLQAREDELNRLPFESLRGRGGLCLAIGKAHLELKRPSAFDFFFLAESLLTSASPPPAATPDEILRVEAMRLLLTGMRRSQDGLVRLHYLRSLAASPACPPEESWSNMAEAADFYLKLGARLDEAGRLTQKLLAGKPTPLAYRLAAQVSWSRGDASGCRETLEAGLAAFPGNDELTDLQKKILAAAGNRPPEDP